MATLAEIQTEIAALRALPPGVRQVAYGNQTHTYASLEEIAARIAQLESQAADLQTTPRPRTWLLYGSKGV